MRYVIGIDEVGRGPLAGPVVVAAVAMPKGLGFRVRGLGKLRDSKKLSAKQRESWFKYFKNHLQLRYSVARVYPSRIDAVNISQAANRAAFLAYQRLVRSHGAVARNHQVLLDGGLYLKSKRESTGAYRARTIIKGDEKFVPIMIASVVAKVTRDRYMVRLAKRYPEYRFEIHKGYGTAKHIRALKKNGPTPVHRLTFIRNYTRIRPIT